MEAGGSRKRRSYGREFEAQILAECEAQGASVTKVAPGHEINAKSMHGWRKLARQALVAAAPQSQFVAVKVAPALSVQAEQHGIEV